MTEPRSDIDAVAEVLRTAVWGQRRGPAWEEYYEKPLGSVPIPVEMNRKEVISWFEDLPLTNFYEGAPLRVEGVPWPSTYATAEHAFQAQKADSKGLAEYIASSHSPDEAKARGRYIPLRPGWEDVKEDIMRAILRAKFAPGREEHAYLLSTGDATLIEGTTWDDQYWGVDITSPNRPGMNRLGILLMGLRTELRREVPVDTCTYCGDPVILLKTDEGWRWATDPTQKQARRWMECRAVGVHFVEGWRRGK